MRMKVAKAVGAFFLAGVLNQGCAPQDEQGLVLSQSSVPRPNVIIILTDDQGYRDVGFNGSKDIPTPNIDRIANEGVRFDRGYVTYPVCGPSRAGLLTGRYQSRFGFDRNPSNDPEDPNGGIPLNEEVASEMLKRAGYRTMLVGKWHMGTHETLLPMARGFDEFYGFAFGGHRYFPEETNLDSIDQIKKPYDWYHLKLIDNGTRVPLGQYLTDELSDRAVDFVRRQGEDPFFLYLAYNAPHGPLQATEEYLSRFDHIENERRRTYAAMISAVDDGVGELLDELDRKGLAENTIIFFLSDNGGVTDRATGERPVADNSPLRGGKSSLFEGGVRVPFAMRYPAKVEGGLDYANPVSSLDILATVASQVGVAANPDKPLDGVDLVPFVTGADKGQPHDTLFWRKFDEGQISMIRGGQKLIENGDGTFVYELSRDVGERKNRARSDAELTDELRSLHDAWNAEMAEEPAFEPLGSWPPAQP